MPKSKIVPISLDLNTSIISPNPTTKTQLFTILNYTTITEYSFKYGPHHQCNDFASTLNKTYSEQFDNAVAESFFIDVNYTPAAPDIIAKIRNAIIDTIKINGQVNHTTIAPIINSILLYSQVGRPARRFPFQTPSSITSTLTVAIVSLETMVVICLYSASLFVDSATYIPIDFSCVTLTRAAPTGGNLGIPKPVHAVTAAAASQATDVVAAATITTTLPAGFNSWNLPTDIRGRYDSFNNSTEIMTQKEMVTFVQPT